MTEELQKGFTCECGEFHEFCVYVYAHWYDELNFECKCGVTSYIDAGEVISSEKNEKDQ